MICFSLFSAQEAKLLKESDIKNLMEEVLQAYINNGGQNEITKNILKSAFKNYFEQFDNNKIYLLKNEVSPFLNATDDQLNLYIQQIQKEDYSVFEKVHQVVISAIERSKKISLFSFKIAINFLTKLKLVMNKGKQDRAQISIMQKMLMNFSNGKNKMLWTI